MKRILSFLCGMVATMGWAALESAQWSVSPAAPLYVGQCFEVRLTLVTAPAEEVVSLHLPSGPEAEYTDVRVEQLEGKRHTTFVWEQMSTTAQRFSFAASTVRAQLQVVQRMGFFTSSQRFDSQAPLSAFSYETVPLPGEAEGLPIGDFKMHLTVSPETYAPGDVVILTASIEARSGRLSEAPSLTLEGHPQGRLYPFIPTLQTAKRMEARAYYALPEGGNDETLTLTPLKVFDLASRQVKPVTCAPLNLTPRIAAPDDSVVADVTLGETKAEIPLRFAPDERAPIVGMLDRREELGVRHEVLEVYGGWSRLPQGWVRTAALEAKEEK